MQSHEIREKFLDFFEERGHRRYPSSSLVPHNDPTVLLTTAGMQQFISYFTGQERPSHPRATSAQKCFRTVDLEEVGDSTHLTFFEMLGNFSFGDYFKKEAIEWAWEFLTKELKLPPERLWITIFEGNEDAPEDLEAKEHWMRVGVPEHRIFGLPRSENWWGPPGDTGPCGPCSEVYYDCGEELSKGDPALDPKYGPGGDEGDPRFIEIWNLVFNQYEQRKDGSLTLLAKPGIDTGMGLERTAAVTQNVYSVYETDLYTPIFERIRQVSGVTLGSSEETERALYVLADHARPMAFLIADGVRPGNQRREYVLRRIIRRATLQAYSRLGMGAEGVAVLAEVVVNHMGGFYEELEGTREDIRRIVTEEAARFLEIYSSGLELLEAEIGRLPGGNFPGDVAFTMHDTYGFPVEVTREVLADRGISLDEAGFEEAMRRQRERAREALADHERLVAAFGDREIKSRFVGYEWEQVETNVLAVQEASGGELNVVLAENPFYATGGGQVADEGWISSESGQLEVFDVVPAGGYVGPDRLRFDYRYTGRVSETDLRRIQEQCLLKITENQPVRYYTTTLEEARNLGALMLFGEKYGDLVRVVEIDGFSRELCGGTHVRSTAEVGAFKVTSNRKHGADLYRIEVLTGRDALYYLIRATDKAEDVACSLRVPVEELSEAVAALEEEAREAREAAKEQTLKQGLEEVGSLVENAEQVNGAEVVTGQVVAADVKGLRQISDDVKNRLSGPSAVVLAAALGDKAVLIANLHPEVSNRVGAGEIVKEVSGILGGGGGGGPTMAQAGGGEGAAIPQALLKARDVLSQRLAGPAEG